MNKSKLSAPCGVTEIFSLSGIGFNRGQLFIASVSSSPFQRIRDIRLNAFHADPFRQRNMLRALHSTAPKTDRLPASCSRHPDAVVANTALRNKIISFRIFFLSFVELHSELSFRLYHHISIWSDQSIEK